MTQQPRRDHENEKYCTGIEPREEWGRELERQRDMLYSTLYWFRKQVVRYFWMQSCFT